MLTTISEKESFKTTQAQVIGISSDPVEKQKEFVMKNKLTVCTLAIYIIGKSTVPIIPLAVSSAQRCQGGGA